MVTVLTSSPQILAASGAGAVCIPDILRVIRVLGELMEYVGAYLSIVLLRADTGAAYENGVRYMRTVALFYPLCFAGNAFAGHFSGCGQVSIPLIGAITHINTAGHPLVAVDLHAGLVCGGHRHWSQMGTGESALGGGLSLAESKGREARKKTDRLPLRKNIK